MATDEETIKLLLALEQPKPKKQQDQEPGFMEHPIDNTIAALKAIPGIISGAGPKKSLLERYPEMPFEGASMSEQAVFSPQPVDQAIATIRNVGENSPQAQFKLDKPTKQLLFRRTPEDKWDTVNVPGMSGGDWANMYGELGTIAGEAFGVGTMHLLLKNVGRAGWGGKIAKGLGTWLVGVMGGAHVGERARMEYAEKKGEFAHRTPAEIAAAKSPFNPLSEPNKAAYLALGGAAVFRGIGELWNFSKGLAKGTLMPREFRKRGLQILDANPGIVIEINAYLKAAGIDKKFKPNSAQILNDPDFVKALDDYMKTPEGKKIAGALQENNLDALEELGGFYAKQHAAGGVSGLEAGQAIDETLSAIDTASRAALSDEAQRAERQADFDFADVQGAGGVKGTSADLGTGTRVIAEDAADAIRKEGPLGDILWDPVRKAAGKARFRPTEVEEVAEGVIRELERDIIPSLAGREDIKVFSDLAERLKNLAAKGGRSTFDYPQFKRFITQVKATRRKAEAMTGADVGSLIRLERAAISDRNRTLLKKSKKALRLQIEADEAYAKGLAKAKQGPLGELNALRKGKKLVQDTAVFKKLFGTDETHFAFAEEMAKDFNLPKYAEQAAQFKKAIHSEFIHENAVDGIINSTKAARWLDDRRQVLRAYLEPDEIAKMTQASDSAAYLKKANQDLIDLEKNLKKLPDAEFKGGGSKTFNYIWKNPDTLKKAKAHLERNFPNLWRGYKDAAMDRIKKSIMAYDKGIEKQVISFDKLRKLLDGESASDRVMVENIKTLFGDGYLRNLETLRDAVVILQRKSRATPTDQSNRMVELLKNLYFGPLNKWGFKTRKIQKELQHVRASNFERLVLDPETLSAAARDLTTSEGMAAWQRFLGAGFETWEPYDTTPELPANAQKLQQRIRNLGPNDPLRQKLENALSGPYGS